MGATQNQGTTGFSTDLENQILVHSQFLISNRALNASQQAVAAKYQQEPDRYADILLSLIAQQRDLSEEVFNKVLSMDGVQKAIRTLTTRTAALKKVADEMPQTTNVITQGTKVLGAAKKVADFANGLG
jgi:hypothetical protein